MGSESSFRFPIHLLAHKFLVSTYAGQAPPDRENHASPLNPGHQPALSWNRNVAASRTTAKGNTQFSFALPCLWTLQAFDGQCGGSVGNRRELSWDAMFFGIVRKRRRLFCFHWFGLDPEKAVASGWLTGLYRFMSQRRGSASTAVVNRFVVG